MRQGRQALPLQRRVHRLAADLRQVHSLAIVARILQRRHWRRPAMAVSTEDQHTRTRHMRQLPGEGAGIDLLHDLARQVAWASPVGVDRAVDLERDAVLVCHCRAVVT